MFQTLKNIYHWLTSWFFIVKYGFPSKKLKIIGITGTDGKTTTSHLTYEMLKTAGFKVAMISTVAAYIGDEELDTGFHVTNPDAKLLQQLLKKIADRGMEYLVLEVTSHGLDQNRLTGIAFDMGVITNITHEHLDYHKTFEQYRTTKAKLIAKSRIAILNADDPNFTYLKIQVSGQVYAYGKTHLEIKNPLLPGTYNLYNVGAAVQVAQILGIDEKTIKHAIATFPGVPGRMEEVKNARKIRTVVDFAHTPNALENVLTELRNQLPKGRELIVVFGCAGLRDRTKRPKMGKIATSLADWVIVTAEDPRTESLDVIYGQITEPLTKPELAKIMREDDRQKAIALAISIAKPGDIVVATGKGHEKSLCFGTVEYPWSDREAFEKAVK